MVAARRDGDGASTGSGERTVAILAMPEVQLLDVSGPLDVFAEANVQAGRPCYRLLVIAGRPGPIASSSSARLLPDHVIGDPVIGALDTLLVAGSAHAASSDPDPAAVEWLRGTIPSTRRYGSVCAGAFLLAATGLLDGRRITTHWAVADRLVERHPRVVVEADAIHVRDGRLRTAAGVTAGLDLALALVEEDLGRDLAQRVAAQLVMFFRRPGGQMQFSRALQAAPAGRAALQEVQRWAAANPAAELGVAALAAPRRPEPAAFRQAVPGRGRHDTGSLGGSQPHRAGAAPAGGRIGEP